MAVSKLKKVIVKFIQFFQENLRCGRDKSLSHCKNLFIKFIKKSLATVENIDI